MSQQSDYQAFDKPEIVRFVFFPRKDFTQPFPGAYDHLIPVDKNVSISCRFYVHGFKAPTILFFHGNGEVVCDYDFIAPVYHRRGINLFVADYRGYGASGGSPTFSAMVADSHRIFEGFRNVLEEDGHSGEVFLMGRSLGSVSAVELAASYPDKLAGLIIESGFASTVRLMARLGFPQEYLGIKDFGFPNRSKIETVSLPTLILHGEYDSMIPLEEAKDLYEHVATERKRLVIIPKAEHNDIMIRDMDLYFGAIEEFVFA